MSMQELHPDPETVEAVKVFLGVCETATDRFAYGEYWPDYWDKQSIQIRLWMAYYRARNRRDGLFAVSPSQTPLDTDGDRFRLARLINRAMMPPIVKEFLDIPEENWIPLD